MLARSCLTAAVTLLLLGPAFAADSGWPHSDRTRAELSDRVVEADSFEVFRSSVPSWTRRQHGPVAEPEFQWLCGGAGRETLGCDLWRVAESRSRSSVIRAQSGDLPAQGAREPDSIGVPAAAWTDTLEPESSGDPRTVGCASGSCRGNSCQCGESSDWPGWLDASPVTKPLARFLTDDPDHRNTGFFDINYYWDEKDSNGATFYALFNLPHDFTYFSLLNLLGTFGANERGDLVNFYTEQNLWHPVQKDHDWLGAVDLNVQLVDASFLPQGLARFGLQCRFHDMPGPFGELLSETLKMRYLIIFHLIETDGSGVQLEHVWHRSFFEDRAYIRGFADHDVNKGGDSDWVVGTQLGVRLFDQFHAVAEHRYNSFLGDGLRSRWRFGIEYNIVFR